MELLSPAFWQHSFPTALQHRRQPGGREIHWRKRPGRRGQPLRNHPDLHRLCLRLQYGMLGHRLPAVRRERIRQIKDRRIHRLHLLRPSLRHFDAYRTSRMRPAASSDPDARGTDAGLYAVSFDLYLGPAFRVLLQHRHRYLYRPRGFQDALLLSGRVLHVQYRRGHPLCKSLPYGRGRGCMGNLFMPGRQLYPGGPYGFIKTSEDPRSQSEKAAVFRRQAFKKDSDHRDPKYPPAELYFRGKYPDPERHQRIWSLCHGRLLCLGEAE